MVEQVEEGGGRPVAVCLGSLPDDFRVMDRQGAIGPQHAEPEQLDPQPAGLILQPGNLARRKRQRRGLANAEAFRLRADGAAGRRQARMLRRQRAQEAEEADLPWRALRIVYEGARGAALADIVVSLAHGYIAPRPPIRTGQR
ncbi:hypothetical protein D9M72_508350 [compost metagenome]